MIRTPFTPFALRPFYHGFFIALCGGIFTVMFYLDRHISWIYWGGGLFLGAVGGLMQIWSVEEVIHERRGAPTWKEFRKLVASTKWGKGYLVYVFTYFILVLFLGKSAPGHWLENVAVDYLSFISAKEAVTFGVRRKLEKAYSFQEKRFEWLKLPRYRETPFRRFLRRWFHFI